jgi:hypothetical protein
MQSEPLVCGVGAGGGAIGVVRLEPNSAPLEPLAVRSGAVCGAIGVEGNSIRAVRGGIGA